MSKTVTEEKHFEMVKSENIHPSPLLPAREHGSEVAMSTKAVGLQVPLIVRPSASQPGQYELIDGLGRLKASDPEVKICVEVRDRASDADVFAISNATFSRKERSAYEVSMFFDAWLTTLGKESGSSEGLQQKLAEQANLSESSLSQYLAIARLFTKLQEIAPKEQFSKLKTWSINKLYKLSELTDDSRLLDLARLYEQKFETPIEEVTSDVDSYRGTNLTQEPPLDQQNAKPETDRSSLSSEQQMTTPSDESRKIFLQSAKKVESLAAENHEMLFAIVQEFTENPDRRYSTDVLQILTKMLRTLRKIRKHSSVLLKKIKPQITEGSQ